MTIQEFKNNAIKQLQDFSPSCQLDVQVLICHFLNLTKTQLLLDAKTELTDNQQFLLTKAIDQRKTGKPIAYITNQKEFYGYNFYVTPDVLIPKPDTEILVEKAIDIIIEKIEARPNSLLYICDMCTGSGCIAISVLKQLIENYKIPLERLPKFTLVDISKNALDIAKENAKRLLKTEYLSLLRFFQSNLFEQVPYSFDVILTNPPYIPHKMVEELLKDGRQEPILALDGDVTLFGERATSKDGQELNDGLTIIKNMILQIPKHLNPKASILMETGEYNAKDTSIFAQENNFKTKIHKDLENQDRVVEFTFFGQETNIQ